MASWQCVINDRDIEMPLLPHEADDLSGVRKEAITIFYSGVEEVNNIENIIKNGCKIMVLMRGLPGSGKSTLARYLMEISTDTSTVKEKHVFSADDYFIDPKSKAYIFNRKFLPQAHSWNVEGVLGAAQTNVTPIIVDNTNLTVCEMWPYACIAAKYDYIVRYLEPSTHWRYNIHECAKRNSHGVSEKHVATMMGRFDRSVSESELLDLVSSQNSFQNYCDRHSNCREAVIRYSQQKHYRCMAQLRSVSIYNEKISERSCIHLDTGSFKLPKLLLDPKNILRALRTPRHPVTQQFVLTSLPSSSASIKFLFSGGILAIHTICDISGQHQTCKAISFRNNVLHFYDQILKLKSFLHLFVSVRNVGVCAAQFMSKNEMRYSRLNVEKCIPLATDDSLGRHGCISRANTLKMMLTVEHGVQPSVNINNVKTVVFPTNTRPLFLPAPRSICGGNRSKRNKGSNICFTETAAKFPSVAKICNVEGRSTGQTHSEDFKDAKIIHHSWDVCDSAKCDSSSVRNNYNYDPWEVCESCGCNSWDICDSVSWELPHRTTNVSDCKPPRTSRKTSTARFSRRQNPVKIEQKSRPAIQITEEATNCSLPKPQRTNTRPRVMQYSWEEYVPKLDPKMTLPPELEAWNTVEDPHSSWERKQNIVHGKETASRKPQKSQNASRVSGNINTKYHTVLPTSTQEEEQLTSKPRREKHIRNRQ
ncbi:uncharacterized protein LOC126355071 [Schistocerca gregaria]|uniref:uncharacterized protein LOC126355071 n=1 Tax=Schistocerca gregaria TaxID=7010 RepID=UPI00211DFA55|nr:uncharacterized protein LOC126355071 [Schistocerca gregaria]XP_049861200.1 uncharacterized protein LOC126355071 [Schistocerca gregaria]